jgi:hypothetical protein
MRSTLPSPLVKGEKVHGDATIAFMTGHFDKFMASMQIGYEQWHDGIGYDLEALAQVTGDERRQVEALLISRTDPDWRDIEALDQLGTPEALAYIERALQAKEITTRIEAAERLSARRILDDERMDRLILHWLDETTLSDGMTRVLSIATRHPSDAIRKKLLSLAVFGNEDVRIHAAALAHHLYGGTTETFDWNHRPLYLRFSSSSESERESALADLCSLIGVRPADG